MNLNFLRTFLIVAENKSFSAAMDKRHMAQSTVSHQIKKLEEELGRPLFERDTRNCSLTNDGEVLLQYAKQIVQLNDDLLARFAMQPLTGKLVIAVPEDYLSLPFAKILASFIRLQPNVELEIKVGLTKHMEKWLENDEIDLAIFSQIPPTGKGLPVYREPLVWLADKDFKLPEGGIVSLALVQSPCLYRQTAIDALTKNNMKWKVIVNCNSHEAIKAAVNAQLAITALTERDMGPNMRTLSEAEGFPHLPMSELSIHLNGKHKQQQGQDSAVTALTDMLIQNSIA